MSDIKTKEQEHPENPRQIIERLLQQRPATPVVRTSSPLLQRSAARLERQAPEVIVRAGSVGVDIEYIGMSHIFSEDRLYAGVDSDWVLGPANEPADAVVPYPERRILRRLAGTDIEFLIYVAHEVDKGRAHELLPADGHGHTVLTGRQADELVGPVPDPAASVALGDRLGQRSQQVIRTAKRTIMIAGAAAAGIAAAPVVLVGGALAALGTVDPIVLGAIPAVAGRPGEPAAFYILARWDW